MHQDLEKSRLLNSWLRWLSFALAGMLMVALVATWYARQQQSIAESRALVAQAEEIHIRDQPAALNLAIKAWHKARTPEAYSVVASSFPQLSATLQGHTNGVNSTVFSPDGQSIVTANADGTARVIRVVTFSQIGELLAK